ncbi:MAG: putative D-alanyl-D-alanine carboxypeptidase, partial [Actinomycetota bacterium]
LASSWYPDDGAYNRYPQQPATSFEALADAVVQAGVVQVAGNVVGDASRYDAELYPSEWPITFRAVEGGPISALLVNDGITRGQPGRAADPAQAAAQEFARLLQERGVVIAGQPTSGVMPTGLPAVASVSSAPLSQVIGEMLRNSDNNTAELLVKEIGRAAKGAGSRSAGTATIRERLESWGVPMTGVVIVDGSGLARENKMTCSAMMVLLDRYRIDSPLVAALAVAGRTGTLADDFIGDPLEARLIGKTGSLTGVKALVGYVPVEGVGTIRFAVMLEGNGVDEEGTFRPIWETYLSDALSSYPSGPTADRLVPLEPVPTP